VTTTIIKDKSKVKEIGLIGKRKYDNTFIHSWLYKIIIVSSIAVYAIITYWLFWPYQPIVFEGPIKILNVDNQIKPGGLLIYEADINKKLPYPVTIISQLINNFVITYSPIMSNIPLGKRIIKVKLKIPDSAEPGNYKLKWEGYYKVNPIREVVITVWSNEFKVVGTPINSDYNKKNIKNKAIGIKTNTDNLVTKENI